LAPDFAVLVHLGSLFNFDLAFAVMKIRKLLIAISVIGLVSCSEEVNEPLSASKAHELLTQATGFSPQDATLLYSWRNCCRANEPFGGWPGSLCAVYRLGNREFDRIRSTHYEKFNWTSNQTKCWGPSIKNERMKGCSEFPDKKFFPNGVNFELHGETCTSDTGVILKIDSRNEAVMVERYFYE
jgi:hypothetical protein